MGTMRNEKTSIQIARSTRTQLRRLKREGETYDQLISRLICLARKDALFTEMDHVVGREKPWYKV